VPHWAGMRTPRFSWVFEHSAWASVGRPPGPRRQNRGQIAAPLADGRDRAPRGRSCGPCHPGPLPRGRLIRPLEERRRRDRQAKGFRGLEVDRELKRRWLRSAGLARSGPQSLNARMKRGPRGTDQGSAELFGTRAPGGARRRQIEQHWFRTARPPPPKPSARRPPVGRSRPKRDQQRLVDGCFFCGSASSWPLIYCRSTPARVDTAMTGGSVLPIRALHCAPMNPAVRPPLRGATGLCGSCSVGLTGTGTTHDPSGPRRYSVPCCPTSTRAPRGETIMPHFLKPPANPPAGRL